MALLLPQGRQYFETSTGAPAVGYLLYAFVTGTTTPKDTYNDVEGDVPNTHPVVLNSRGEASVYWSGTYDLVLKDSDGSTTIWGPEALVITDGPRIATVPNSLREFAKSTGAPLVGGLVYTYIPGTSTPKDTYTTDAGTVALSNPVVLDANGEAVIYGSGSYDVFLKDETGATIWGPERFQGEAAAVPASYTVNFGQDLNGNPTAPLSSTLNSTIAHLIWSASLTATAEQDFESYAGGEGTPLSFVLSPGGTPVTVTMTGASVGAAVVNQAAGTSANGRYSVPSATSSKYWSTGLITTTNLFVLDFDTDLRAFGFWGIDIGDFEGQLTIEVFNGSGTSLGVFTPAHNILNPADGAVIFWGIRGDNASSIIRQVKIRSASLTGDVFAFDRLTISING